MSKIGIIANPHSKLNKRNPNRQKILGFIVGERGRLEVTNTLDELKAVVEDFSAKGVEIIAINGGDGTISRTLTAIIQAFKDKPLPKIALLRGGTMNVIAGELQIKGLPEQVLYRLIETHSSGLPLRLEKLRTIQVDGEYYGFLFGNGAAAYFLEEFYKKKTGSIRASWLVIKLILSRFFGQKLWNRIIPNFNCHLKPRGLPGVKHQSCAVFCSTVQRLPLGVQIFPDAKKDPAKFQCVSAAIESKKLIWKIPFFIFEKKNKIECGKMTFITDSLKIETDQSIPYTLDGEIYLPKSNEMEITVGPEINFVVV